MRTLFTNVQLCLPEGAIRPGALAVAGGAIAEIDPPGPPTALDRVIDGGGCFLSPGFIDLHVHGALGRDAMEASREAFEVIARHHASGGTTSLTLTTVCAPWEEIHAVLEAARAYRASPPETGARLVGIHVEGPFFSREKLGAHRPEYAREPAEDDPVLITAFRDVVTQMTLAPELPGAIDWIRALRAAGIRASGGHSDAWDEEARAAIEAGLCQATHTFNCMSASRRLGPYRVAGLLECVLADPRVLCELIADGQHVSPTLIRMLYQAKGSGGIALITDATAGTGLPVGSEFRLGAVECRVEPGVALTEDGKALAGSTCRMIDCVRTLVGDAGIPLSEALRMATEVPTGALGARGSGGSLAVRMPADLVLFDDEFSVRSTWVGGREVFSRT